MSESSLSTSKLDFLTVFAECRSLDLLPDVPLLRLNLLYFVGKLRLPYFFESLLLSNGIDELDPKQFVLLLLHSELRCPTLPHR